MIHTKSILAAASIFVALTGCKDIIPPSVTNTTPPDGAVGVDRSAEITATFDEDIFSETVDESTFVLAGVGDVNGAVSFDAMTNIATFTPNTRLATLKTYQATLTTGITDLFGNSLASDYKWSFTTTDGGWVGAEQVPGIDTDEFSHLQVGVDGTGNAIVVWQQNDEIWATYYTVDSGWKTPELIVEGEDSSTAVNRSGDTILVWSGGGSIFTKQYSTSTGWEETETIGEGRYPKVAIDEKGNVMVVWTGETFQSIAFKHYVVGSGWLGEEVIFADGSLPGVGMDAYGNAISVWRNRVGPWDWDDDYSYDTVCSSRFTPDEGWIIPVCAYGHEAWHPKLKVSTSGNAIVVYGDSTRGGVLAITVRYYTLGLGWEEAFINDFFPYDCCTDTQINIDPNGNSIIVRRQWFYDSWNDKFDRVGYVANYYSPESGLVADGEIVTENLNAEGVQLDGDAGGNAIAVWYEAADCDNGKTGHIWANRYFSGSGWGEEEEIEAATSDCFAVGPVHLDVNEKGDGIAVWTLSDSEHTTLWANRFE